MRLIDSAICRIAIFAPSQLADQHTGDIYLHQIGHFVTLTGLGGAYHNFIGHIDKSRKPFNV